jgi:hypothetical protein
VSSAQTGAEPHQRAGESTWWAWRNALPVCGLPRLFVTQHLLLAMQHRQALKGSRKGRMESAEHSVCKYLEALRAARRTGLVTWTARTFATGLNTLHRVRKAPKAASSRPAYQWMDGASVKAVGKRYAPNPPPHTHTHTHTHTRTTLNHLPSRRRSNTVAKCKRMVEFITRRVEAPTYLWPKNDWMGWSGAAIFSASLGCKIGVCINKWGL